MHRELRESHRAVSLALRLEGITKEYGTDIMVGEEAKNAVPGATFPELDRMWAKGEGRVAAIYYEPLEVRGQIPRLYHALVERANLCAHSPGSGWDGAFTFETE